MKLISGSPFASGNWTVGITADPSGKFIYAANFSGNDISAYSINNFSGALTPIAGNSILVAGSGPQSIAFDGSGGFAYITDISGGVVLYSFNPNTGILNSVHRYAAGNSPAFIILIN